MRCPHPLPLLFLALAATSLLAQPNPEPVAHQPAGVRISIGSVTKYTGSPSTKDELQKSRDFLATLETQLAAAFVRSHDVDYLDRSHTDALFNEVHLSSDASFDPASGALRGLWGRLDYLIVVESSTSTTARVRVIDVETGAVKAVAMCEAPTNFLGLHSKGVPECVPALFDQTLPVMKAQLAVKQNRLAKAESDRRAAEQRQAEQKRALDGKRAQEMQAAREKQAEDDRRRAEEEQAAEERDAEVTRLIDQLRPHYESSVGRLSEHAAHWQRIRRQLNSQGLGLRRDVESALTSAQSTEKRCTDLLADRKPGELNACLDDLDGKLNQLERYR